MSNAVIPLDGTAKLPSYIVNARNNPALAKVNQDVFANGPSFPFLSIKGKTWTVVKNGEKKLLTVEQEGEQVPRATVKLVAIRANTNARTYFEGSYDPAQGEGVKPTCYTNDGVAPAADAAKPQSNKCAICPWSAKGSKVSSDGKDSQFKGSACARNTRLAVMDPEFPDTRMLLRVPPASRWEFGEEVKKLDNRGIPYNAAVFQVKFDPNEPSPKLLFKTVALLSEEMFDQVQKLYDSDEIKEIVGLKVAARDEDAPPALPAPAKIEADELDAAITAQTTVAKAAVSAKEIEQAVMGGPEAPKPAKPKAEKAKPKPVEVDDADSLLADIDKLMKGDTDD